MLCMFVSVKLLNHIIGCVDCKIDAEIREF